MRPSLPTALQYIREEENINYLRKGNSVMQQQQNPQNKNVFPQNNPNFNLFKPRPIPLFNNNQNNFINRQNHFASQQRTFSTKSETTSVCH